MTRSDNAGDFTVDYLTARRQRQGGSDYVGVIGSPNTVTFTAGGALTQQISITINGDTDVELDEDFTVTLGNLVNTTGSAAIGDGDRDRHHPERRLPARADLDDPGRRRDQRTSSARP